jgi:DNA-binding response OmpR family regulator
MPQVMNAKLHPLTTPSAHSQSFESTARAENFITVIIADNDPASRRSLAEGLERLNCMALEYSTGIEAIEAAECEDADVILLSTRLPDTDGLNAIEDLKSNLATATLPIIAFAQAALRDERSNYLEAGAAAFVTKPAGADELHRLILKTLSGWREETETDELDLPDAASF